MINYATTYHDSDSIRTTCWSAKNCSNWKHSQSHRTMFDIGALCISNVISLKLFCVYNYAIHSTANRIIRSNWNDLSIFRFYPIIATTLYALNHTWVHATDAALSTFATYSPCGFRYFRAATVNSFNCWKQNPIKSHGMFDRSPDEQNLISKFIFAENLFHLRQFWVVQGSWMRHSVPFHILVCINVNSSVTKRLK